MKSLLANPILFYLRLLAKLQLKKNSHAIIIGITGSAGKTSTRRALSLILSQKGRVKESKKANSQSGIPLNILGLSPINYSALDWLRLLTIAPLMLLFNWQKYDFYVVEMGIDSPNPPKNMSYLLKIIRPHVGIVLNAGLVHGAAFDHLVKDRDPRRRANKIITEIAKEKMKLAQAVQASGTVIVNSDQPELRPFITNLAARTIKFGHLRSAAFRFNNPSISRQGFSLPFNFQGKKHTLTLPTLFEQHYAYTFSAAIAAASTLGIPPSRSCEILKRYTSPAGRLRVFPGIHGTTILDSSYNASPQSMASALALLRKIAGKKPTVAVVGDMRELGQGSKHAHKLLADQLLQSADRAILFGTETKLHTLPVLKSAKFPARHFSKMKDLTHYLQANLKPGSYVLVKGSQNTIFLERAVQALLNDPHDAQYLCRRGKYWDNIRANSI